MPLRNMTDGSWGQGAGARGEGRVCRARGGRGEGAIRGVGERGAAGIER